MYRSSYDDDFRRSVIDRFDALNADMQAFRVECKDDFGWLDATIGDLCLGLQGPTHSHLSPTSLPV